MTSKVLTWFSFDLAWWLSFWPQVTQIGIWPRNHQDKQFEQFSGSCFLHAGIKLELQKLKNSKETDNCPTWISGKERMTMENISWSISMKECCRLAGVKPATSWSPVRRAINWDTKDSFVFFLSGSFTAQSTLMRSCRASQLTYTFCQYLCIYFRQWQLPLLNRRKEEKWFHNQSESCCGAGLRICELWICSQMQYQLRYGVSTARHFFQLKCTDIFHISPY